MQYWMSDCIAHTDTQLAVQKRISNIKLETLPADLRCLLIPETSQVPCLGLMLLVTEFHPQLLQSMFLLPIKPRHRTADFTEMLCALCCCTFNESTQVIQKRKCCKLQNCCFYLWYRGRWQRLGFLHQIRELTIQRTCFFWIIYFRCTSPVQKNHKVKFWKHVISHTFVICIVKSWRDYVCFLI